MGFSDVQESDARSRRDRSFSPLAPSSRRSPSLLSECSTLEPIPEDGCSDGVLIYNATVVSKSNNGYNRRRKPSRSRSSSPSSLLINGQLVEDDRNSPIASLVMAGKKILEDENRKLERPSAFTNVSKYNGYKFHNGNDGYNDNSLKRKKEQRAASFADLAEAYWNSTPKVWSSESFSPTMDNLYKDFSLLDCNENDYVPPRPPTPEKYSHIRVIPVRSLCFVL